MVGFCLECSDKCILFHMLYGLGLSSMFVQLHGITRDKHSFSGICVSLVLIHIVVIIPAAFYS